MGIYTDKITVTCSTNTNRPTVEETFNQFRAIWVRRILEKHSPAEQKLIVEELQKEGLLV